MGLGRGFVSKGHLAPEHSVLVTWAMTLTSRPRPEQGQQFWASSPDSRKLKTCFSAYSSQDINSVDGQWQLSRALRVCTERPLASRAAGIYASV